MHWWDLNPKFSAIFSCIGGMNRNLFGDLQLSRILIVMHWWDDFQLQHANNKVFSVIFFALVGPILAIKNTYSAIKNTYWTLTQNLFSDFQLHWWDRFYHHKIFSTIFRFSARWFPAIKKTFWHALVTCIGGTWTRNLFGNAAIKNTYFNALVGDFQLSRITLNTKSYLFGDFQLSRILIVHALVGLSRILFDTLAGL